MTGADGAARFEGLSQAQIRTIFVDDVAVQPPPDVLRQGLNQESLQ